MVTLIHERTGQVVGEISEEDFEFLINNLEEEDVDDSDYYIDEPTIEVLRSEGASATLVDVLTRAVAAHGPSELTWNGQGA